jgi:hypothetical protein
MIGDEEHHVGQVDTNSAKHIYSKAVELGFSLAPLTNFSKPILQEGEKRPVMNKHNAKKRR